MEKHKIGSMLTWADRIQHLRDQGMTLGEIGEKVGLSIPSVADLAKGRTKSPRGDAAMKLHALHRASVKGRSGKRASA